MLSSRPTGDCQPAITWVPKRRVTALGLLAGYCMASEQTATTLSALWRPNWTYTGRRSMYASS